MKISIVSENKLSAKDKLNKPLAYKEEEGEVTCKWEKYWIINLILITQEGTLHVYTHTHAPLPSMKISVCSLKVFGLV